MAQMKEQNKTPGKELNEMEMSNLSDAEFKTMVIRMLKEITRNCSKKDPGRNEGCSKWNKEKSTNSGGDEAEIQINDLEHKEEKSIQSEQQEEKRIQKKPPRVR